MSPPNPIPPVAHDPDAVLDYIFDWTEWLAPDEVITGHTISISGTVTQARPSTATAWVVTAWLTGGTRLELATVTCHIVTDAGREDDRSIRLRVVDR